MLTRGWDDASRVVTASLRQLILRQDNDAAGVTGDAAGYPKGGDSSHGDKQWQFQSPSAATQQPAAVQGHVWSPIEAISNWWPVAASRRLLHQMSQRGDMMHVTQLPAMGWRHQLWQGARDESSPGSVDAIVTPPSEPELVLGGNFSVNHDGGANYQADPSSSSAAEQSPADSSNATSITATKDESSHLSVDAAAAAPFDFELTQCSLTNASICHATVQQPIPAGGFLVVVYNPLGFNRVGAVRIPVPDAMADWVVQGAWGATAPVLW